MAENTIPGCFKYGCIGCLTLIALFAGLVFVAGAVQFSVDSEDPMPEQRQLSQDLPPSVGDTLLSDRPEGSTVLPLPQTPEFENAKGGTILLDLAMAEVFIEPGPADEPIRVDADFDAGRFDLVESFSEDEDGTWLYKLSFKPRKSLWSFFGNNKATDNRIELTIPRDRLVELVGEIGMGESESNLGGLWLRRVDLEYGMGDHFMEFREPLPYPMNSLRIDGSMGNVELRGIGNSSPREVSVEHSMGDLLIDLDGHWRNDAQIKGSLSMGQIRVWVPDEVRVDADADVSMGEVRVDTFDDSGLPDDTPLLSIDVDGSMGSVVIER